MLLRFLLRNGDSGGGGPDRRPATALLALCRGPRQLDGDWTCAQSNVHTAQSYVCFCLLTCDVCFAVLGTRSRIVRHLPRVLVWTALRRRWQCNTSPPSARQAMALTKIVLRVRCAYRDAMFSEPNMEI